ncbi:hypothetical protein J8281_04310 [Aquimarina sp. U1-2]|uniref:hypothetical protein n=1 Tax=Aquimarina sp. U1-2 TaxID=2823141 RepID=UPI001AECE0C7|nr:hypothetical protein [Aquimarina sp. U1-2]MBP2831403.1 hypothetical protein [Aquimarina sp. U1-2]
MDKFAKIWLLCAFILFIVFMVVMIQTFRPVTKIDPEDVMKITGKVINIEAAPGFDIAITLENDNHYYYINRGLQQSLAIEPLRTAILNKNVTLYTLKRWTIFTPDCNMGHIAKIVTANQVVFNKINNDDHEQTTP